MYLIDGNPGAGKTTFAMQFLSQGVADGETCLYVTLSETAQELRSAAESHNWSLEGIEIVELIVDPNELEGDGPAHHATCLRSGTNRNHPKIACCG